MSKTSGVKRGAVPRGLSAALAGLRAGGALAVDGAVQQVLARSGLRSVDSGSEFSRREARRFVAELGRLKGTYVKIGQMFAMLGEHFLPPVLTEALHDLGGSTEPLPWTSIAPVLEEELGPRRDELVIEREAFAAASLAQVHRATVAATGENIVLKVQYPGLAEVIDSDFDAVVRMLKLARWLPAGRDLDDWLRSMRTHLHHEIDYQREAQFAGAMAMHIDSLAEDSAAYHVPKVYSAFSSERVLALEYIRGQSVNDPAIARLSLKRRNALAQAMLELFFIELYAWGVLQTDPNFGNYLIQTAAGSDQRDKLVLLDFGSMLECNDEFLRHLRRVIAAGLEEDVETLADGLVGLGCLQPDADTEARALFAGFCLQLLEPLREPSRLPREHLNRRGEYRWGDSRLMQRAGKLAAANSTSRHFTTPSRDFALIARKLTGVFTFISVLDAQFNGHELVMKHIQQWREREAHG
ncbi:MAG: AarF/ABC1/UbiB kinase family protein [Halieaceae bacterium]|jgi:predicted unusual protein kinase regulating ubiquinone biosynthesis (AarF/ABC1/UbiB family)|nr:AarF/ABC1/UbiB kinase family protein [Halieaceae bacterium]